MAAFSENDQEVVERIKTKIGSSGSVSSGEESNDEHGGNIPKFSVIMPEKVNQINMQTANLQNKMNKKENEAKEEDAITARLRRRVNEARFKETKTRSLTYPLASNIEATQSDQKIITSPTKAPNEYNKVAKNLNFVNKRPSECIFQIVSLRPIILRSYLSLL